MKILFILIFILGAIFALVHGFYKKHDIFTLYDTNHVDRLMSIIAATIAFIGAILSYFVL